MQNFKMLSAVVETDAEVINPNGEKFVDLMVKPGLPMISYTPPGLSVPINIVPPQVYGLLAPGEAFGEELTIRIIPQRHAHANVGGGMFPIDQILSNQTDIVLLSVPLLPTDSPQDAFTGVPQFGGSMSWPASAAGLRFTKFRKEDGTPNDGSVRIISLKWMGAYWLASALSSGIYIAGDPEDVVPTEAA